jgi:hypothetical protein
MQNPKIKSKHVYNRNPFLCIYHDLKYDKTYSCTICEMCSVYSYEYSTGDWNNKSSFLNFITKKIS